MLSIQHTDRGQNANAPKMACTPIISVKKAEPNRSRIVIVMKNIVGPFCIEPVLIASHRMIYLTGKRRTNVHPTHTRRMYRASTPAPPFTRATERAKSVQPIMSFPTPADSTTIPTVVSRSLSSVRMRHRTGKAVMEYATPVNSIKFVNLIDGSMNWW